MTRTAFTPRTLSLAVLAVALLGGCASFSPDGGFDAVQSAARSHLQKDVAWARDDASRSQTQARIDALLAQPLSADDAVQIALLNNPGLQAAFNTLGIAEADRVAAGRLPNPGFSIGRMTRGSEVEWERSLHLNLARLLTMPMRIEIEQRLFEQTRQTLVLEVLRLAAETRRAWVAAVAAGQTALYQQQAMEAAEAGAELARRMAQVGNWSKLKQAREQSFYADAALAVARAEQAKGQARERLVRLMGLDEGGRVQLPDRLPDLPEALPRLPDIEQQAMDSRLDLQMVKLQTEALAKNLGLTRSTRLINVLELGISNNSSNQEPVQRGYEISFELPLFDWGQTRVVQAESRYRQALARARETAVNARSEVREAYAMQQGQYAIARHLRDEVVPLKQRISEENLLRYNGMLIGVFELLADARSQIASVNAAIEAQRDFWLADADLAMALVGTPGKTAVTSVSSAPAEAAGGH
ncbi:MAG TPA: TolC family protein [Thiobacillus sp.]|nr:MAG: RND transporter [Hydrogenophilales bacterium 16-64-40]OZA34058.1 MAG: RND transporter [Hydrogenophilales bacterium 17-64-65]HQS82603.1 TolC family protein [Thiobacillus sp.]HQT33655.1 TolC family protein [Thiobacillus sp.]